MNKTTETICNPLVLGYPISFDAGYYANSRGRRDMCGHDPALTFETILADSLVRLVMIADGVSEEELRIVLENARDAVISRDCTEGSPRQVRPVRSRQDAAADLVLCGC